MTQLITHVSRCYGAPVIVVFFFCDNARVIATSRRKTQIMFDCHEFLIFTVRLARPESSVQLNKRLGEIRTRALKSKRYFREPKQTDSPFAMCYCDRTRVNVVESM